MNKQFCAMIMIYLSFSGVVQAGESATLTVNVMHLKNQEGVVDVALFDSEASFMKVPYRHGKSKIGEKLTAQAVFVDVAYGDYAVTVIHDMNNNGALDTGLMRIPKEPYAFSNGARGRFGPAKFSDARFEVLSPSVSIVVQLIQ